MRVFLKCAVKGLDLQRSPRKHLLRRLLFPLLDAFAIFLRGSQARSISSCSLRTRQIPSVIQGSSQLYPTEFFLTNFVDDYKFPLHLFLGDGKIAFFHLTYFYSWERAVQITMWMRKLRRHFMFCAAPPPVLNPWEGLPATAQFYQFCTTKFCN